MIKQFLGYVIPSALAMCVASINTIINAIFLGNGIGNEALLAVNIVISITIVFFGLLLWFLLEEELWFQNILELKMMKKR